MTLRALVLAVLLLAGGVAIGRALISHDGVGPVEYVVGAALIVASLLGAVLLLRPALPSRLRKIRP